MKLTNRHAIEAQRTIGRLNTLNLPIKTSYGLAVLTSKLDEQTLQYGKQRDQLVKDYKIKLEIGNDKEVVSFTIPTKETDSVEEFESKEQAIAEFTLKVNALMLEYGEDIDVPIVKFPSNLIIQAETIKPLLPFIEIDDAK